MEKDDENLTAPGHFFSVNESFAKELKKKLEKGEAKDESGGFSFLEMMGRKNLSDEAEDVEEVALTCSDSFAEAVVDPSS